jgi:hypothetical protein
MFVSTERAMSLWLIDEHEKEGPTDVTELFHISKYLNNQEVFINYNNQTATFIAHLILTIISYNVLLGNHQRLCEQHVQ